MQGKFVVAQKELLALLSSMQPICNKRTTLTVTESILFEVTPRELTLKSTDMEISLQSTMPVESTFEETARFVIPGKRIFDLVKEIDGEIAFEVKESNLRLKASGVNLTLNIRSADDFPPFPERIENLMEMNSEFVLQLLNKVAFLIPQNNANPSLNGMLLEIDKNNMTMVSTDGHCLSQIRSTKYTLPEEKKWLLPKRAVLELKKLLEAHSSDAIFLGTCGQQLVFSGKNFNFFTRLIAEPFPQYKPILEKEGFKPAQLDKDAFLKTLKRTSCLLSGQFVSTNFSFTSGAVKINLHNKDVGKLEESIPLEHFEGDTIESRFYSPYLLNGLQVFSDDQVKFFIKNGVKPIIFETSGTDYNLTYLVMPVSLASSQN